LKLSKIYKEVLKEDLEYNHVSDASPDSDEYMMTEKITIPNLSLPQEVILSNEDKVNLSKVQFNNLDFEQLSNSSPVSLKVILPWENDIEKGVALYLQIINDSLYQIHISIHENLQKFGLGYKIYKALITQFGNLYSGKGRRHNNAEVPRIWEKLNSEPGITCTSNDDMELCVYDRNPDAEKLLNMVNKSYSPKVT